MGQSVQSRGSNPHQEQSLHDLMSGDVVSRVGHLRAEGNTDGSMIEPDLALHFV